MSKIKDLINRLCPNGVRYYNLGDVCQIEKGKQLNKEQLSDNELYPVMNGGISPSGYWNEYNFGENRITISQGGASAGYVNYLTTKFWAGAHCYVVDGCNAEIDYKYIYHFLKEKQEHLLSSQVGAGIPSISLKEINSLKIPLPPMEVQEEIVRILDKFDELKVELEDELVARKIQYEFCRNKFLEDNKEKVKFGDVATIVRGGSPRPIQNYITTDENGVPWIKIGDTNPNDKYIVTTKEKITSEGSKKSRFVKTGEFLLSNSMSFGRPFILKIDGCIHDGWLSISNFEDTYIPDFLYHLLSSKSIQDMMTMKASVGTMRNLNVDIVKSIELPLYNKNEQKKIIRILDQFEKLINDESSGLPAELELRRKQCDYYRNRLFSFKELKNE